MTKFLKISPESAASIDEAIATVAGRKKAFIHSSSDIIVLAKDAEKRLEVLGIPTSRRAGASAHYVHGGPAKAYRYNAQGTCVRMLRKSTGWVISSIALATIRPGSGEVSDVVISEAQRDIAVAAHFRKLGVCVATHKNA